MIASDLICPLIKEKCIRERCICYSTRNTDTAGFGFPTDPYGTCEYFKINLDFEIEGGGV